MKCIVLGALTFPTPFLVFFYLNTVFPHPNNYLARFYVVIFLILAGGLIGVVSYYRDSAIEAIKDWIPSADHKEDVENKKPRVRTAHPDRYY